MEAYESSSQYRSWSFPDSASLYECRQQNYEAAKERIDSSSSATAPASKRARIDPHSQGEEDNLAPLTAEQEQVVLQYYALTIRNTCVACRFNRAISATAVSFFQRFFLFASPREYHPSGIADTAIFLAIKTEACPYSEVADFCRRLIQYRRLADADVVSLEVPLLMGLRYHITVHQPYRPLKALLLEAIDAYADAAEGKGVAFAGSSGAEVGPLVRLDDASFQERWDALQQRALDAVDVALVSDARFLYTPSQIAAGCLLVAGSRASHGSSAVADAMGAAAVNAVSWFIQPYLQDRIERGVGLPAGFHGVDPRVTTWEAVTAVAGIVSAAATAAVSLTDDSMAPLLHTLHRTMSRVFQRGTKAYEDLLAARDGEAAAYKAEKASARAHAAQAFADSRDVTHNAAGASTS